MIGKKELLESRRFNDQFSKGLERMVQRISCKVFFLDICITDGKIRDLDKMIRKIMGKY